MHLRGGHLHLDVDAVVPAEGDDSQGPPDGRPEAVSSEISLFHQFPFFPISNAYEVMNVLDDVILPISPCEAAQPHFVGRLLTEHGGPICRYVPVSDPKYRSPCPNQSF